MINKYKNNLFKILNKVNIQIIIKNINIYNMIKIIIYNGE